MVTLATHPQDHISDLTTFKKYSTVLISGTITPNHHSYLCSLVQLVPTSNDLPVVAPTTFSPSPTSFMSSLPFLPSFNSMVCHSFGLSHHPMLDKPQSWSNPSLCLPPHLQGCSSMAKENHKIILTDFPSSSRSLSASSSFTLPGNHILLFWSIHLLSPRGPLTSSP